ncbi:hypothetical protein ACU61A_37230 [Pseudonocardia sichuanensis]|uniref:Uncharacterized protein n=1 Tax=Pseudonocardia kunmingensis TaxID=630975 RepID=A0A543D9K0_9PSEU|nr:hypothetical protein [Pseudonocardia kunmingensis]TQM06017.1 hypothetical protein FB558_6247 [Pseudonocardia kunmingensis]
MHTWWKTLSATIWSTPMGTEVRARWEVLRRDPDAGYSTEAVLVTALLVVAALVVVAIIVAKVTEKANGIVL